MMSGVRASSMRMLSTSSTMAKWCPRCTIDGKLELHVVAQVVEAELVVGAVGDVGPVGHLALLVVQLVLDDADPHAQEAVEAAHPLRVAAGQVVVDGDDVDALAGERVEVGGQGGDQRLALAGLHLGDLPLCSTMPPISCTSKCRMCSTRQPASRTTAKASASRSSTVAPSAIALPELGGLGAELLVGEGLDLGFERADLAPRAAAAA